ncbi:MAG: GNAT family N-acetyltransferase [Thermosynechococcaceae cyanobacterium]
MKIRFLDSQESSDDVAQVLRLQDEWVNSGLLPEKFNKLCRSFLNENNTIVLEHANTVVGYLVFFLQRGGYYEIDSIYISNKYRKQGLGKTLIEHTENQIKVKGGTTIKLCAMTTNNKQNLISFYKILGYTLIDGEDDKFQKKV